MDRSDLQSAVVEVLVDLLKVPVDIDPSARLADHGLTSMQSVSLVMAVEDRFGIVFQDQLLVLDNFTSVENIVDLVASTMKAEDQA